RGVERTGELEEAPRGNRHAGVQAIVEGEGERQVQGEGGPELAGEEVLRRAGGGELAGAELRLDVLGAAGVGHAGVVLACHPRVIGGLGRPGVTAVNGGGVPGEEKVVIAAAVE